MRSVSQVEGSKKHLVKDVDRLARLGVRFVNSPNGSFLVYHNSESSLVEVKSKKHLDQSLMEFKEYVLVSLTSHSP